MLNALHLRDHSVEPPIDGPSYPVLVSAVDADGNGLDGLRHPLLSASIATHTGWAVRIPGYAAGDCPVGEATALCVANLPLGLHAQLSSRQAGALRALLSA